MRTFRLACLALAGLVATASLVGASEARADEASAEAPHARVDAPPAEKPWEVQSMLYGWLPALSMTVDAGGLEQDTTIHMGDVFGALGWSIAGTEQVRYERALLLVDWMGSQLHFSGDQPRQSVGVQLFRNGPGATLTAGPLDVHTRTTMWMVDTKVGFRAYSTPMSRFLHSAAPEASDRRMLDFDLFAGARYWNIRNTASVSLPPATLTVGNTVVDLRSIRERRIALGRNKISADILRKGSAQITETTDWIDAVVGFRVRGDFTDTVGGFLLADVGGFGIGSSSKFTYQTVAGLNWSFAEHVGLVLAYRVLGFVRAAPVTDLAMYGPMVGMVVRF